MTRIFTEQDAQPGQRPHALYLHYSRRQVKQLRHCLDAVILPVAQDDDGAVPRAELPESVQQREAELRGVGRRRPVRYRIGPQLGRALEPLVIEIGP
jgi:hypothetical protein